MIVVDTNVIVYLTIQGRRTEQARNVMRSDPDWRSPALWRDEFINVLATAVRTRRLTDTEARSAWWSALDVMEGFELAVDDEQTLNVALERKLTAYDARFVAAALASGTRLVTGDAKLARACPDVALALSGF